MQNKKTRLFIGILVVMAIAIIVAVAVRKNGTEPITQKTFIEEDFDFQVTYPSDWGLTDQLSARTCCLFIDSWDKVTSMQPNASGTPVETVTATQNISIQIGNYDRNGDQDPFKSASTTKVTLGGTEFYSGIARDGMEFYLLPRTDTIGIGAALFANSSTTESHREAARKVISTIKLLPVTVGTSTATTTPAGSK